MWKSLGAFLDIPIGQLENIRSENHLIRDCCREMLITWLERTPNATWDQILLAVNELSPLSESTYQGMNHTCRMECKACGKVKFFVSDLFAMSRYM